MTHCIASREEWLEARLTLLQKEKAHSRARDEITRERQQLPWVHVNTDYVFEGPDGPASLGELFGGKSQLIVYHFMFDTDWNEGCKSCSFVTDHLEPSMIHLLHRDTALVVVSKAPWPKLHAFKMRMGWTLRWVSSGGCDFNRDYQVSLTDDEMASGTGTYNFRDGTSFPAKEAPGISTFVKDERGDIYHTYSAYARGLETFIGAYNLLDIVPKGRDEAHGMKWVRHKDNYGDGANKNPWDNGEATASCPACD